MSKLLLEVRERLTFEESCKYLQHKLGQYVAMNELLQFVCEEKIKVQVEFAFVKAHKIPLGVSLSISRESKEKKSFGGCYSLPINKQTNAILNFIYLGKSFQFIEKYDLFFLVGTEIYSVSEPLKDFTGKDARIPGIDFFIALSELTQLANQVISPAIAKQETQGQSVQSIETPLKARERNTYLSIIGGLLDILTKAKSKSDSRPVYGNQGKVIAELGERFGLAESTLKGKFAEANAVLKGREKSK